MFAFQNKALLSFSITAFLAFIATQRFTFPVSRILDFEVQKCPFCFSQSLCESLPNVSIELSFIELLVSYLNRKYVFFGNYNETLPVVIKRLASENEVGDLDSILANRLPRNVINDDKYFYEESLALLHQSFTNVDTKLRLCPTLENVELLFQRMTKSGNELFFTHIWTSLKLNPEPLILQVFNFENGWSVPKYVGACGRIIVAENCGKPIRHYWDHPWLFRVHIFEQLLSMAHNFTFDDPNFGVYFKDISPDNLVIDENMKVRLVDLEHIIIVDKTTRLEDQPSTWHTVHESEHFHCDNCITYSPANICNHRISDHNVYAVCQVFLSSTDSNLGLLHSSSVVEKLKFYADECVRPTANVSRFAIAEEFVTFLQEAKMLGNFSLNEFKKLV